MLKIQYTLVAKVGQGFAPSAGMGAGTTYH